MKKFLFLMVAALALCLSCSLLVSDGESSRDDFGSITVDFGTGSRSLLSVNSSTVTNFIVNVGNGVDTDLSKEVTPGGSAEFADLAPGTYTVKALAYMNDVFVQSASDSVTVKAGEASSANLIFNNARCVSEKLVFPINSWSTGQNPSPTTSLIFYDDISAVPQELVGISGGFSVNDIYGSFIEDNDGRQFYIVNDPSVSDTYHYKSRGVSPAVTCDLNFRLYNRASFACYDRLTDSKYCFYHNTNETPGYFVLEKVTGGTSEEVLRFAVDNYWKEKGIAVEGNNIFIIKVDDGSGDNPAIVYGKMIPGNPSSFVKVCERTIYDENSKYGATCVPTDIKFYDTGKFAVLVSDMGLGFDGVGNQNSAKSRGALLLYRYDDTGFTLEKEVGWYGSSRTLTTKGTFVDESGSKEFVKPGSVVENYTMYGPSRAEAKSYFYGPQRIICIKPKELYIADEGINVNLADWTKRDPNSSLQFYHASQKGLSGNFFIHSRIVRVDLENFGLNVERDYVQAMFGIEYSTSGQNYSKKIANRWLFSDDVSIKELPFVSGALDNAGRTTIGNVSTSSQYLGVHATPVELEE